ncbi:MULTISPECIES: hypothetical protein [Burkholderia]|uniref:hypothetical protein n=1 Tax=Burkholderia TaxID=32008 RepID=UPI0012E39F27|nr:MULTISPECIES: hypothetical protein [Burkholderia]
MALIDMAIRPTNTPQSPCYSRAFLLVTAISRRAFNIRRKRRIVCALPRTASASSRHCHMRERNTAGNT